MVGETARRPEQETFQPHPKALDIVRLDGRWVQVLAGNEEVGTVRFLDDGTVDQELDWTAYRLVAPLDTHLRLLADRFGESLTDEERQRLHYGPEQHDDPDVIDDMHIFGVYERA